MTATVDPLGSTPVRRFLDELASGSPTPGGGSAAAVIGAMGAALASMVCNLTIGKKGHEGVEAAMRELLDRSEALRARLDAMVADDIAAFDAVMAGYRMPKATESEKAARAAAIQAGLKRATESPLACARLCAEVVRLCGPVADQGNGNVISDAGVGVLAGYAALRSAALNVQVNVPQLKDREFAARALAEVEALLAECGPLTERIHGVVRGRLG